MFGLDNSAAMKRNIRVGIVSALIGLLTDQVTKMIVVANASSLAHGKEVLPGFDLVFSRNGGVSFGMLGGLPWWGLVYIALGICAWLAVLLVRTDSRNEALAYGAIIGGALGNIFDRIRFQAVTDFLDFHVGDVHWPAFNFADVFVVCGFAVLLLNPLWSSRQSQA